jgi:phage terminase small subunit
MADLPTVNPLVATLPAVPATVPTSQLPERMELFVQELLQHGNVPDAYMRAYPRAGSREAAWANGSRLRARQDVQARIRELQAAAAERALIKPAVLLMELYELATADPAEVSRVIIEPCPACWSDEALAAAGDRWLAGEADPPDSSSPQPHCKACKGRGIARVVFTPTDQLRGAARRLYQGAKVKSDGSVEVQVVDQLAARKELHALLGLHVSRSINANINVPVALPEHVTATDALAFLKSLTPS